jgi:hypothetical protein
MASHARLILKVLTVVILFTSTSSYAEECFNSSKKLNDDAQTIRLKAMDMGWKVGKLASTTAASIVKGKTEIYPKDKVEICLREANDTLQIKAQSKSKDAGKAKWNKIIARKIGSTT